MNTVAEKQTSTKTTNANENASRKVNTYRHNGAIIQNHEDGALIRLPLVGFNKEEVSLSVKNNLLTIKGTVKPIERAGKFLSKQFSKKSFERSFKLDQSIDQEAVKASFENGILEIELSKKEAFTAVKKIEIA